MFCQRAGGLGGYRTMRHLLLQKRQLHVSRDTREARGAAATGPSGRCSMTASVHVSHNLLQSWSKRYLAHGWM